MATYPFGVAGETNLEDGTYGLLQSFTKDHEIEEAVAQNAKGKVADQTTYNPSISISTEYIIDSEKTLPVPGDTITVGATDVYRVMKVGEASEMTGYKRGTIELKRYTGIPGGIPANA